MALIRNCAKCGNNFIYSQYHSSYCNACNEVDERTLKEKECWTALSADEKIEELLKRVKVLEEKQAWDGKIG